MSKESKKSSQSVYVSPFTFTVKYPEKQNEHMVTVKPVYHPVLDENYVYRDKSFSYRFKRFWFNIFLSIAVIPTAVIRYAVKVEGRENYRKNKKLLKNGFVSVCNHVCEWDYLAILAGLYPRRGYFPIWSRNMETNLAPIFKLVGGIPVPTSVHAGFKFNKAMDSVLEDKKWLHVYAEGSMWFFYPAIREFQDGAFVYSYRHNVPVLPMAISYREPKGIYKLFKKHPNLTLHIGEPVMPDLSLSRKESCARLSKDVRLSMIHLMGMKDEAENQKYMDLYKE